MSDFIERHYDRLRTGTLVYEHVKNCRDLGLSDEKIQANLIGPILISASNTMGISSALFLLDPGQWERPLEIDFNRDLSPQNHIIFGGAKHVCIGKTLAVTFLRRLGRGFVRYLPDSAHIVESEIELDGSWVAERIITKMPIRY